MQQNIIPSTILSDLKYSQTKLEIDDYEKYKLQLLDFMTKQKPHLEPNLTIDELSAKTNIPQKYLSQTINTCFNLNFNSFINSYRVTEAKCLMESDINNSKTIYHILLDSGFNSKSVFNVAFKKFAGITPKEYRLKIKC
jgi:AraC-like DNA-binding protein